MALHDEPMQVLKKRADPLKKEQEKIVSVYRLLAVSHKDYRVRIWDL
jgi:hypothetical protein